MPRTARVFIENACYHIISRGNQKETVFRNSADFNVYLKLMHKYKIQYGCYIYSYCLMQNHVHLILESPLGQKAMTMFMHCLNQSYAMLFNSKYNRVGHVWQDRYKSFVVLKDNYLFNLISYIEYNPVRAGIVKDPAEYNWCSYKARVIGKKNILLDKAAL